MPVTKPTNVRQSREIVKSALHFSPDHRQRLRFVPVVADREPVSELS